MVRSFRAVRVLILLACGFAAAADSGAAQDLAERSASILRHVEPIARGGSIEGRRAAITGRLAAMGLEPELLWFDPPPSSQVARRGANVTARVSEGFGPTLLLGAHYDAFDRAQGVIDNAAGVGAVLELAAALSREPLKYFSVDIVLFDLEEDGLLGSRAMVRDSLQMPLPAIYLNFDIFGYGDSFWVGSVDLNDPLPKTIEAVGRRDGLVVIVDSMYPSSDYLSFRGTSAASYAISLLDHRDIEILLNAFRSGGAQLQEVPRIFQIMHTTEDTLDKLDASAVARGVSAVEKALRELDEQSRAAGEMSR